MANKPDSHFACNLLEQRIQLCDNIQNLMLWATGVSTVKEVKLRGYVNQSAASWADYPWTLQCRVCSRFATEALTAACNEVKSGTDVAEQPSSFKTKLSEFTRHFTWDNPLSDGELDYQFCGSDPMMQHLIAGLVQRYDQAENDDVTLDLGDDFDMEDSEAMKAVKSDLQEARSGFLACFMSDTWLAVLEQMGDKNGIVAEICGQMVGALSSWESVTKHWRKNDLNVLAEAIDDAIAMARCFLTLLGVPQVGSFDDAGSPAAAVFVFSEYKGRDLFRRAIRGVLAKEIWAKEVVNLTKTAGSAALLRPKLAKLSKLLEQAVNPKPEDLAGSAFFGVLSEMKDLFGELTGGIREMELRPLRQKGAAVATNVAQAMMECDNVKSELIPCALQLLRVFADVPGVVSAEQEFQVWASKRKSQVDFDGFLHVLCNINSPDDLDVKKLHSLVPQSPPVLDATSQSKMRELISNFIRVSFDDLVLKASCWALRNGFEVQADVRLLDRTVDFRDKGRQMGAFYQFTIVRRITLQATTLESGEGHIDAEDVKLIVQVVNACVGCAFSGDQGETMCKFVGNVCTLLQVALKFAGGVAKLRRMDDRDKAANKHEGLMKTLKLLIDRMRSSQDGLEQMISPLLPDCTDKFGSSTARMCEWPLTFEEKFKYNDNAVYNMRILDMVRAISSTLKDGAASIIELSHGYQKTGQKYWRAGLDDSPVPTLLEPLKTILKTVDGKKLRDECGAFMKAMETCEDIITKFGGVGLSLQVHEEMEGLKSECDRISQSQVKYSKLLVLETFLLNADMKLSSLKPGADGNLDEASSVTCRNMKALILEEHTFLFKNKLGLSEADVHQGLLAACKKHLG
ncbi:unnamed protein product [Symbiodinium sp. CCMP2592]|nr:unnamed protein product [Symbiodinium sp. CCMP2592]